MFGVGHDTAEKLIAEMLQLKRATVDHCNLCGADQYRVLVEVGVKNPLKPVMCCSCGLIRLLETLPKDILENIGKHGGSLVRGLEMNRGLLALYFQKQLSRSRSLLTYLEKHIGPIHQMATLDLICEVGGFVQAFQNKDCRAEGIDLSEQSRYGQDQGLTIHRQHILDFKPKKTYDIITGIRFINHFSDVRAVMTKLKPMLSRDGVIFFETLDIDHALRRKSLEQCIKADHPYMFTTESFRALCDATGFEIVALERDIDGGHDFGSLNHMHSLIRHQKSSQPKTVHPVPIEQQYDRIVLANLTYISSFLHRQHTKKAITLTTKIKSSLRKILAILRIEPLLRDIKYRIQAFLIQKRDK